MERKTAKPQIETIVKRVVRDVKFGKKDPSILNQLCNLTEYIEKRNYTSEEMTEAFPVCANRTYQELKRIRKDVYNTLYDDIKSSDYSMMTTYRIYVALVVLYPERHLPMSNPKIKLCDILWGYDNTGNFNMVFEMLGLMDKINQK